MKKIFFMAIALTAAFTFTSCRSSESAYKKAYEKAQAAQNTNQQYTQNNAQYNYSAQQTTPVEVTPVTPTTTYTTPTTTVNTTPTTTPVQSQTKTDYSNVTVRTEKVTVVSGSNLKDYSVVVGSFSVKANADALKTKLGNAGFASRVIKAQVNGSDWYRVVAASYDTKDEAAAFRASQQSTYPDAWLLYAK